MTSPSPNLSIASSPITTASAAAGSPAAAVQPAPALQPQHAHDLRLLPAAVALLTERTRLSALCEHRELFGSHHHHHHHHGHGRLPIIDRVEIISHDHCHDHHLHGHDHDHDHQRRCAYRVGVPVEVFEPIYRLEVIPRQPIDSPADCTFGPGGGGAAPSTSAACSGGGRSGGGGGHSGGGAEGVPPLSEMPVLERLMPRLIACGPGGSGGSAGAGYSRAGGNFANQSLQDPSSWGRLIDVLA